MSRVHILPVSRPVSSTFGPETRTTSEKCRQLSNAAVASETEVPGLNWTSSSCGPENHPSPEPAKMTNARITTNVSTPTVSHFVRRAKTGVSDGTDRTLTNGRPRAPEEGPSQRLSAGVLFRRRNQRTTVTCQISGLPGTGVQGVGLHTSGPATNGASTVAVPMPVAFSVTESVDPATWFATNIRTFAVEIVGGPGHVPPDIESPPVKTSVEPIVTHTGVASPPIWAVTAVVPLVQVDPGGVVDPMVDGR